jgi:hypothetical protein
LPNSVERALADALSLEHPDVPWTLPAQIPPPRDLQLAIAVLTVAPASPKHASWCLAKLALAFESGAQRLSPEATKLRADVWLEANADLGDELWSKATIAAIRGSKWMPKPAEFRELVSVELAERSKKLSRCRSMLAAGGTVGEKPKPFVRESQADRLRSMRDSFRKFGNVAKAAQYERESAALDGREPEEWALNPVPAEISDQRADLPKLPALSPSAQARLNVSLAREWRKRGNTARADALEAEAVRLAPELYEIRDNSEPVAA